MLVRSEMPEEALVLKIYVLFEANAEIWGNSHLKENHNIISNELRLVAFLMLLVPYNMLMLCAV